MYPYTIYPHIHRYTPKCVCICISTYISTYISIFEKVEQNAHKLGELENFDPSSPFEVNIGL